MKHFYETIGTKMFNFQTLYRSLVTQALLGETIVELGSWVGESLAFLLVEAENANKDLRIVSVDAFLGNVHGGKEDPSRHQWEDFRRNLAPVWPKVTTIKSLSAPAARFFPDESVFAVFVDADHHYDAVTADLNLWWPKVRKGGIFAGHDLQHEPIQRALATFIKAQKLPPWRTEGNCWWFPKPI